MKQMETKTKALVSVIAMIIIIFIWTNSPIRYLVAPDQIVLYNNGKSIILDKNHEDYTYILDETRSVLWKNALNIFGRTKSAVPIKEHEGVAEELIFNQPKKFMTGSGAFISFYRNNAEMFLSGGNSGEYRHGGIRLGPTQKLVSYIIKNVNR
jgi:hypothetical protein